MKFVVRLVAFFTFVGMTHDAFAQMRPLIDASALRCVRSGGSWRMRQPILWGSGSSAFTLFCDCNAVPGKVNALTLEDCPRDGSHAYDYCVTVAAPAPWTAQIQAPPPVDLRPEPAPSRPAERPFPPAPPEMHIANTPPLPPPTQSADDDETREWIASSDPPAPAPQSVPTPPAPSPREARAPAPDPAPAPAPEPASVPSPEMVASEGPPLRAWEEPDCDPCDRDVRIYLGLGVSGFTGPELTIKLGPTVNVGLSFEPNDHLYFLLDGGVLYTGERRLGAEVGLMEQYYPWRYVGFGVGGRIQWDNIGTVENGERALKAEILHVAATAGVAFRDDHGAYRLYLGLLKGNSVFEDGAPGTLGGYGSVGVTF